jgi:inhibitor of cysteine peptidase
VAKARRSGPLLCLALLAALVFALACSSDTPAETTAGAQTGGIGVESTVPAALTVTEAEDGGSLEIQAGGIIKLSLPADPGTGYAWEMDDPDPEASLLEQVEEPVFVSDDPDAVGAGGIITYTFRAVDRGKMVVRLAYFPPDPTKDPVDTFQVDLTVR